MLRLHLHGFVTGERWYVPSSGDSHVSAAAGVGVDGDGERDRDRPPHEFMEYEQSD